MVLLGVLLGTSSEKVGRIKSAFLTKVTCSVVTTGIPLLPLYSISNVWSQHVSFSPLISIVHMVIARLMLLLWVYGACFEQHLQQSHLPLKFVLPPHISGYGPFTHPPPPPIPLVALWLAAPTPSALQQLHSSLQDHCTQCIQEIGTLYRLF